MAHKPGPLEQSVAEAKEVAWTLRDINLEDINSNWIDKMVKRLFKELEKQLVVVEKSQTSQATQEADNRAIAARTLETLQRTMERLTKMEAQRIELRAKESEKAKENARASFMRKLADLHKRVDALGVSGQPDGE